VSHVGYFRRRKWRVVGNILTALGMEVPQTGDEPARLLWAQDIAETFTCELSHFQGLLSIYWCVRNHSLWSFCRISSCRF
jgi:hypothetical protein